MPVERFRAAGSFWVQRAGHTKVRRCQRWLITIGGAPFLWFLAHRDFASNGFYWSAFALMVVPALATICAAVLLRCSVCGMLVYAFWLLGFPRGRERTAFDTLPVCPYCLDDGSGRTGDANRVDRHKETQAAIRYSLLAIALFVSVMAIVVLLGVLGWLPGR